MVKKVSEYQSKINDYLSHFVRRDIDQQTLSDSMTYSLMAGGKRLRPSLTLATVEMLGGTVNQSVMKAACALELLHTYSLIHDDLPAMDNDPLRRGKATNHVRFGAGMATLAGDGLLTLAFQWLSENGLPVVTRLRLVQALSEAAGPAGMVAGQTRDIHYTGTKLPLDQLRYLHRQKTGALLRYSVMAGGIITNQNQPIMDALAAFGASFGLAFQIYDDILDVTSTPEQLGKATHKDAGENKNTYPSLLGLDGAKQQLAKALDAARHDQSELSKLTGRSFAGYDEFLAYFK